MNFSLFFLMVQCTALEPFHRFWKKVTKDQIGNWQLTSNFSITNLENCVTNCSMEKEPSLLSFKSNGNCSCFIESKTTFLGSTMKISSSADTKVFIRPNLSTLDEQANVLHFPEIPWKVYLSIENKAYDEAYLDCKIKLGRLAIVDSQETFDGMLFVKALSTTSQILINGRLSENGEYVWYEHPEIPFPKSFWADGEPRGSFCVYFWGKRNAFDDSLCSRATNYLCEIP